MLNQWLHEQWRRNNEKEKEYINSDFSLWFDSWGWAEKRVFFNHKFSFGFHVQGFFRRFLCSALQCKTSAFSLLHDILKNEANPDPRLLTAGKQFLKVRLGFKDNISELLYHSEMSLSARTRASQDVGIFYQRCDTFMSIVALFSQQHLVMPEIVIVRGHYIIRLRFCRSILNNHVHVHTHADGHVLRHVQASVDALLPGLCVGTATARPPKILGIHLRVSFCPEFSKNSKMESSVGSRVVRFL